MQPSMFSPLPRLRRLRDVIPLFIGAIFIGALTCYLAFSGHNQIAPNTWLLPIFRKPVALSGVVVGSSQNNPIMLQPISNHAEDDRETLHESSRLQPAFDTSQEEIPETEIVTHKSGWTVFRNLYMSGGTLVIVTSTPDLFPEIKFMTSTGLPSEPGNAKMRTPTSDDMDFLSPEDAKLVWGSTTRETNRVLPIKGNTWLFNDPPQFLHHYYHFCAELLVGTWAFWAGTYNSSFTPFGKTTAPPVDRAIFVNSGNEWRDKPGFNSYFLRAAFPSLTVETEIDWLDRIEITHSPDRQRSRAFRFDTVLLADRTAAFEDEITGSKTQRTAATAFEPMKAEGRLNKWWWEPIRRAVVRFAGVDENTVDIGVRAHGVIDEKHQMTGIPLSVRPFHQDIVVTYISRQGVRRRLITGDHESLVTVLTELCRRRGWELNVIAAEELSKDEQVKIMARTTVLLGVHGNGLSHLILLPITPRTTVIEIFYPGGFARDYEWTSRAMGFKHFAVRYDTYATYPKEPLPNYPDGFQGENIPVHAPTVARLIEDRIDGKL